MCDAVLRKWSLSGPRPLNANAVDNKSGLWLFTDRTWPSHFFPPNFLPPYDVREQNSSLSICIVMCVIDYYFWLMSSLPDKGEEAGNFELPHGRMG